MRFDIGGVKIIVDYAHNPDGLRGVMRVAQQLCAPDGRIGMLLGTRKYRCQPTRFAAGALLTIEASCLLQDGGMASFDCRILLAGEECAQARLSTYQPSPGELSDLLA